MTQTIVCVNLLHAHHYWDALQHSLEKINTIDAILTSIHNTQVGAFRECRSYPDLVHCFTQVYLTTA